MAHANGSGLANLRRASPGSLGAAFSLIELLVVIAIIAVLIGLLLPGMARSRDAAKASVCLSRLHNLHVATRVYADQYGTLPVEMPTEIVKCLEVMEKAWRCPADPEDRRSAIGTGYSSYSYLAPMYMDPPPTGLVLTQLKPWVAYRRYETNPLLPLFWDTNAHHDQDRNVVYWNGSASRRNW